MLQPKGRTLRSNVRTVTDTNMMRKEVMNQENHSCPRDTCIIFMTSLSPNSFSLTTLLTVMATDTIQASDISSGSMNRSEST